MGFRELGLSEAQFPGGLRSGNWSIAPVRHKRGKLYRTGAIGFPRTPFVGNPVPRIREGLFSVSRVRPVSLLTLLYLLRLALEDFHQFRRNIGVVAHHFPFPLFTPVDVRHPPINTYRLLSKRRLAMFSAKGVGHIVG